MHKGYVASLRNAQALLSDWTALRYACTVLFALRTFCLYEAIDRGFLYGLGGF